MLFVALPLAGSIGSGCGGVRGPESDIEVTRTVGSAHADIQLGPARVFISDGTFTHDVQVTLRRLPYDGSGSLVGPLFEIATTEPFPAEALSRSKVEYEVAIVRPDGARDGDGDVKLAYKHEGAWFGFNDGGSALTERDVVRGTIVDASKQPFRIAPVRRCGKDDDCSSRSCINATVCQ